MKHQNFPSKLDEMTMKITRINTNRYKSRLDGLKMKICKAEEKHILTIISVYAPTTALIRKDKIILEDLYLDFTKLINKRKN